jgi:hypothetical protein
MFVVKDTFQAKPGQGTALIEKFKNTFAQLQADGIKSQRVLVDVVATYWTVILETEVEDLDAYFAIADDPAAREGMAGYMDHVVGGERKVFKIAASI